ncbi:MAG: alpha-amylase family glycosyl hydrolase [Bacillus subtilis]|nr:alpha-amylase family glycosyl hydrolase [Bacillus subtilis]
MNEFKQLMATMSENGLRVIMDVVYNHTGQSGDSNFNMILPGYYYRMNSDGSFSNGSGTGNETASERYMMRKFMVDSVDLLGGGIQHLRIPLRPDGAPRRRNDEPDRRLAPCDRRHDPRLRRTLDRRRNDPRPSTIAADKANLIDMPGVAAFNDDFRNAVKGNPDGTEDGFVQDSKTTSIINRLKYGVAGGVQLPGITTEGLSWGKFWNDNPSQTLNYVTAHDNLTLYDKLMYTATFKQKSDGLVKEMQKQANALVLTAQGIPFLHAGEEFLRSKPCVAGDSADVCIATKYNRNSYQSPDAVNQLRWDLKAQDDNMEVFEYYKDLIELRKTHPAFRLSTAAEVEAHLDFIDFDDNSVLGYTISDYANGDSWDTILVIHNTGEFATVTLPSRRRLEPRRQPGRHRHGSHPDLRGRRFDVRHGKRNRDPLSGCRRHTGRTGNGLYDFRHQLRLGLLLDGRNLPRVLRPDPQEALIHRTIIKSGRLPAREPTRFVLYFLVGYFLDIRPFQDRHQRDQGREQLEEDDCERVDFHDAEQAEEEPQQRRNRHRRDDDLDVVREARDLLIADADEQEDDGDHEDEDQIQDERDEGEVHRRLEDRRSREGLVDHRHELLEGEIFGRHQLRVRRS